MQVRLFIKSVRILVYTMKILLMFFLFNYGTSFLLSAQHLQDDYTEEENRLSSLVPSLYLDCGFCDFNYIREELPFVNYVRDPNNADIHIFVTRTPLVRGGSEHEFSFLGLRNFSSISFDLTYQSGRDATSSEIRDDINKVLQSGLMPYLAQSSKSHFFQIDYDEEAIRAGQQEAIEDPWNYWVFEAYLGAVTLGLESNRKDFNSRWGIWADRVTEDWKLRFRPYFNYTLVEIQRDDEDDVLSTVQRHGIDSYAIKSLNQHWSAGLFATYLTRDDRNIRHRVEVNPGVEYSFLPYREASRRAITLQYQVGYTYAQYFEETIFGVTRQNLFNQQLRGSVNIQQPWGNLSGGIIGSHYLHDADLRRAIFFGSISVRIREGLSLNFSTNFQMIQDQLSLPAGDASLEDILLQRRELATDYSLSTSVAITYTFGSDFANIVNTRF